MKHTAIKNKLSAMAVVLTVILTTGCSKESDNLPEKDPALQGVAKVSFASVATTDFDGNPTTRADGSVDKETISYNLGEEQGFMLEMQQGIRDKKTPQTRAVGTMENGTHYRVVIYKTAEYAKGKIYAQSEYLAGNTAPVAGNNITLEIGTYKVFAYSINTAAALPELTGNTITVNDGQDFMTTDVADLNIAAEHMGTTINYNSLLFKRKCCNIWVNVESKAFSNTAITNCTVTLKNLPAQANWTVGGGTFAQIGTSTVTKTFFNNQSGPSPLKQNAICLPIDTRVLIMDSSFKTNNSTKTFTKSNQSLKSIGYQPGSQYKFQLTGARAYVPTVPSAVIGGVRWAATNANSGYQFAANPWDYGYYFKFSSSNACPGGWRKPTPTELGYLPPKVLQPGDKALINGSIKTIGACGWAGGYAVFREGNEILCLIAGGYRSGNGSNGTKVVGEFGYYWSDQASGQYGKDLYFGEYTCSIQGGGVTSGLLVRCVQSI